MLRFFGKLLKIAMFICLLVIGFFMLEDMFFSGKIVAIVHNNQDIRSIERVLTANNIVINNVNTHDMSTEECINALSGSNGVIFAGGNDFDPDLYGGDRKLVEEYSREDDDTSMEIMTWAIENKKPILGICRGMQLINLYYGGSLYDDLQKQFSKEIIHRSKDKSLVTHGINIEQDSILYDIYGKDRDEVNSYHHQGIKDLADGLKVGARSDDGLIEEIENPYHTYMMGVQRHPELDYENSKLSEKIFKNFIKNLK